MRQTIKLNYINVHVHVWECKYYILCVIYACMYNIDIAMASFFFSLTQSKNKVKQNNSYWFDFKSLISMYNYKILILCFNEIFFYIS